MLVTDNFQIKFAIISFITGVFIILEVFLKLSFNKILSHALTAIELLNELWFKSR